MTVCIFLLARSDIDVKSLTSNIHTIGEAVAHYVFGVSENSTFTVPEILVNEMVRVSSSIAR